MPEDRPLAILNPHAGGGSAGRSVKRITAALERRLGAVDIVATEREGHAIELAERATREGRTRLLALGGDGTVHEVANGILAVTAARAPGGPAADPGDRPAPPTLGIVGCGTGGDLARTLGLRHDLDGDDGYLASIARGRTRALDVGRATYTESDGRRGERFFVNILSAGMSGLVDRYVGAAGRHRVFGASFTYLRASVHALLRAHRGQIRMRLHGAEGETLVDGRSYLVAICNGRYFGAGMHVAPMADPADGRFEVVSIDAPSKVGFALSSRSIWRAGHLGRPGVSHRSCQRIHLELIDGEREQARERFVNDIDGEPKGGLPLDVELVPHALSVFV